MHTACKQARKLKRAHLDSLAAAIPPVEEVIRRHQLAGRETRIGWFLLPRRPSQRDAVNKCQAVIPPSIQGHSTVSRRFCVSSFFNVCVCVSGSVCPVVRRRMGPIILLSRPVVPGPGYEMAEMRATPRAQAGPQSRSVTVHPARRDGRVQARSPVEKNTATR